MRAVVQRVEGASVRVHGVERGRCGPGLLLFVGVRRDDEAADAERLARRIAGLRVFPDEGGRMNRSLGESPPTEPAILAVSNFTVYAEAGKSRRPSFSLAAPRERAEPLFDLFVRELRAIGLAVEVGVFGADMAIEARLDGPVTVVLESKAS